MKLNKAQSKALLVLYHRSETLQAARSYLAFRRSVMPYYGGECVIVPWCGMMVGIESDGYCHS